MKKKGLLFLLTATVLFFCVALSACSLVSVNEERQANRVIATVSVDLEKEFGNGVKVLGDDWDYNVSMNVTRRELIFTVNYAINYYSQLYAQYGMQYTYDAETLLESSLKTLKAQKYNTAYAMGELLVKSKDTGRFDSMYCFTDEYKAIYGKTLVPEGVLTLSERYKAVKAVNDQFDTQLTSLLDTGKDQDRENEKSDANNELVSAYNDGFFVKSVEMAYKNADGEFVTGIYDAEIIDDGDDDTAELDYKKIYVKVRLTKGGADVNKADEAKDKDNALVRYVVIPVEEDSVKTEADDTVSATRKYMTAKRATVSFSGREFAEVTEDNDSGYEVATFTSEPVKFTLVTARSAHNHDDSEDSEAELTKELRYFSRDAWKTGVVTEKVTKETLDELKSEIFNAKPETYPEKYSQYTESEKKEAYRQLRSTFVSSNIGYVEEISDEGMAKLDKAQQRNLKHYNGLAYYYESQFSSEILSAIEYELGEAKNESVTNAEIDEEYNLLVLKDKANYEYLSDEEQVKKFFETVKGGTNGLDKVYYVPVDALTKVEYEIKADEKAYKVFFNDDGTVKAEYKDKYVFEKTENGKTVYTMKYAYKNEKADGTHTYTINMIYVTHILLSFDNVEGLTDKYKAATLDLTDDQKIEFAKKFAEQIKTCPQLLSFLENFDHDKTYEVKDVFKTDENGKLAYQTYAEAIATINAALEGKATYKELFDAFVTLMEQYNDDSGKLTTSGYVVSAGDMENGWYADFTATALEMYFEALVSGKNPTELADGEQSLDRIRDAYSDYGIHKMIISFAPLFDVTIDESTGAMDIKTALNTDGDTRYEELGSSLLKSKKSKAYTEWRAKNTEEIVEKHSETNEKNYKRVVKDIKG